VRQAGEGAALARGQEVDGGALIVVAGPTASGKTELAAALALRLGGEVVSADSRQVYRLLDAATAKPPRGLRERVPHHLIDCAAPSEAYDAARFAREAGAAIADIRARGRVPVVCGGTGLYLAALLEGLTPLPPRDPALRARLEADAAREGRAALHARLAAADPAAAAGIPPANAARVIRALEVLELTGRPISAHWAGGRAGGLDARVLRLEVRPEVLKGRLEARAAAMWPALMAEVRALVPARLSGAEPGLTGLGYREAMSVLRGERSEAEGLAEMIRATAAYAKRQRTWFRRRPAGARAVDASGTPEETLARALAALEETA
jgi:tRNA dimethylallyltransferase